MEGEHRVAGEGEEDQGLDRIDPLEDGSGVKNQLATARRGERLGGRHLDLAERASEELDMVGHKD